MSSKVQKTNALRELDNLGIEYLEMQFEVSDDNSALIDEAKEQKETLPEGVEIFKTLVCTDEKNYYVFVIGLNDRLDLKKAAKAAGTKRMQMILQRELKPLTGYIHGGCSPLAMKKHFPTYIDEMAQLYERIAVSAGKVGLRMILKPQDLLRASQAEFKDLIVDKSSED